MRDNGVGNMGTIREISGLFCCILCDTTWQMRTVFLCRTGSRTYAAANAAEKPNFFEGVQLDVVFSCTIRREIEVVL